METYTHQNLFLELKKKNLMPQLNSFFFLPTRIHFAWLDLGRRS